MAFGSNFNIGDTAKGGVTPGLLFGAGGQAAGMAAGGFNIPGSSKYTDPFNLMGLKGRDERASIEKQRAADKAAMQEMMDKSPAWIVPRYVDMANPTKIGHTSHLSDFDTRLGNIDDVGVGSRFKEGTGSLDLLQERAFGKVDPTTGERVVGIDPWTQMQLDQQSLMQQQGKEDIGTQAALGREQQFADMAARGGLGGGARERMAKASGRGEMEELQRLQRGGQAQRLGILGEGERQRLGLQASLPGQELQYAGYESGVGQSQRAADIQKTGMWGQMASQEDQRRIAALEANRAAKMQSDMFNRQMGMQSQLAKQKYEQDIWGQKMAGLGAGREADVIASQASTGGMFGNLFG